MKTLRELLNDFLEHRRLLHYSSRSITGLYYDVRLFLRWLELAQVVVTPAELRAPHLRQYLQHLLERANRLDQPLKPRSVNKFMDSARHFLRYLVEHGHLPKTWPDLLERIKEPKHLPTSVLTHEQVKTLLACVDTTTNLGYRNRTMLELIYSAGLRAGELLGLNIGDLDLPNATALVTGKGDKQRVVPVGRTALRYLETYLRAVRPFLLKKNPAEPALFLNQWGGRMIYTTFRRMVQSYAQRAALSVHVTTHTFRRSCATEMLRGGANMYHVKELLGHERLDTLKHYVRLTITDLKKTHAACHPREKKHDL